MEFFSIEGAPKRAAHYSPAVKCCNLICISGQLPIDPYTGEHCKGDIIEQTKRVLTNLELVLQSSGATIQDVMKVTVYVSDIDQWGQVNEIYSEFFGDHKPARTIVPTPPLHYGFLVELDAMAFVGSSSS